MIDYYLYIPACFLINLAFGPNNLMALSNGAQSGVWFALLASFGRLVAFAPMIAISALGLGVVLAASAWVFTAIKVFGACYLIWIGLRLVKGSYHMETTSIEGRQTSVKTAFRREMFVAFGNPKAIVVFAAFFPQFVVLDNYAQSYAILGGIFLILEIGAILIYAGLGQLAARRAARKMHLFQRVSGIGMMVFGALMVFTKRPEVL